MNVSDAYIGEIGYAVGSEHCHVSDTVAKGLTFSDEQLLTDSGFLYHFRAGENQTAYDLAREAVENLCTSEGKDISKIDGVLYATCLTCNGNLGAWNAFKETKDVKHLMDFPVSHLQADFNIENSFLMGLNQTACTSLLGALRVGKSLLSGDPNLNELLCLTSDRFPPGAAYEQTYNLISDGAAACVLSRKPGRFRLLDCHHLSNGVMAQANDDETAGFYFNYTYRVLTEILTRNQLSLDDIDWIVPQNTNIKAWEVLASILRIDYAKVLTPTRNQIGHCISGDNLINLRVADDQKKFKPGDKILLPMAGFGLNWSCVLIEKV